MRPFSAANLSSNFLLLCIKTAAVRMPEGTATVGVPCRVPLTSGNEARGPSNHDRCPLLHSDVLLSRQKRLGNTPQGLGDSRQLLWGGRLFAVRTLDEDAPLVVDLVGDENGPTTQVAVAERAPATIRRHIWHREGESPRACDRPRDSTSCYDTLRIKAEGTGVKVSSPHRCAPSRSRAPESSISYETPESVAEVIRALPVQKRGTRSASPAVTLTSQTCPGDSRPDAVVQSGVCIGRLGRLRLLMPRQAAHLCDGGDRCPCHSVGKQI